VYKSFLIWACYATFVDSPSGHRYFGAPFSFEFWNQKCGYSNGNKTQMWELKVEFTIAPLFSFMKATHLDPEMRQLR
jgi:hypothetical protein